MRSALVDIVGAVTFDPRGWRCGSLARFASCGVSATQRDLAVADDAALALGAFEVLAALPGPTKFGVLRVGAVVRAWALRAAGFGAVAAEGGGGVEAAIDAGVVDVADAVGVFGDQAAAGLEGDVAAGGADRPRYVAVGGDGRQR